MAVEGLPDPIALAQAFEHEIYDAEGHKLPFRALLENEVHAAAGILVIFIRHFFCGNCQEYIRRLSSSASPFHPSHRTSTPSKVTDASTTSSPPSSPRVVIIGPGMPTLIPSYQALTVCAYPIYADPSTQLYDILGMHRTLSMGDKAPEYIQHSLLSGAVKSAWQIVKRVGNGDAMSGGEWNQNGGEFLFVRSELSSSTLAASGTSTSTTAVTRSTDPGQGWQMVWCHRMVNSRDHSEIEDLHRHTSRLSGSVDDGVESASPSRCDPTIGAGVDMAGRVKSPFRRATTNPDLKDACASCSAPNPDAPKSHLSRMGVSRSKSVSYFVERHLSADAPATRLSRASIPLSGPDSDVNATNVARRRSLKVLLRKTRAGRTSRNNTVDETKTSRSQSNSPLQNLASSCSRPILPDLDLGKAMMDVTDTKNSNEAMLVNKVEIVQVVSFTSQVDQVDSGLGQGSI